MALLSDSGAEPYFLNPNNNVVPQAPIVSLLSLEEQPVALYSSTNVTTLNNAVDTTSGRMFVTDLQFNELAAYAPGVVYRVSAYKLGTFENPAITLTDSAGKVLPVTIKNTTMHALDVQIPVSAALGGAYLTLVSGGTKYFGTLFIDSQDNIPAVNGCTYETSLSSSSVAAAASSLPILVVTQNGCSFWVLNADSFVIPGASATGTAVISVGFAANAGPKRSATIEIAGQPITLTQGALIPTIQGIADSWDYTVGLAPGAWVTITGTDLASGPPQTWDLSGTQQLPTTLGDVTVTFDGTPAALFYVSATQINALVPASVASGRVQVVVRTQGVSSNPFAITSTVTLPSVYALPTSDGSAFFITAALAGTAALVGNSAVDPRVTRAVRPGDTLDLYMLGLGATNDPTKFVTNQVFAGAYPVSAAVTANIRGEPALVLFAGLTSPGLYLVRIVMPPDLAAGPRPIQVTAGGAQTRSSLMLLVGTP